ncbi:hypothetical protein ACN2WE_02905 [Streptomyces sp. cg28]|uniref:hypothetical protein n=1 Tax=Streptomyces sp. cg28 TaxID=3403457 RepID=UPI003B222971
MELPEELIALQRAADDEGRKIEHLDDGEREQQRAVWFDAAARAQEAVTEYAAAEGLDHHEVEKELRQVARHTPRPER